MPRPTLSTASSSIGVTREIAADERCGNQGSKNKQIVSVGDGMTGKTIINYKWQLATIVRSNETKETLILKCQFTTRVRANC